MSERIPIQIYDDPDVTSNNPVADLGEAKNIQYRKRRNEVWTASFDLPVENEKNDHFYLFDFAEIYDGDKRVGLFRIDEREPVHSEDEEVIRYQCSHVLDTLNDDRLAITAKTTKTGTSTALNYILGEQDTAHWQLGTLDFSQSYEYEFSRQTLLKALFDVPKPWWEDYRFTFDTTTYPWTLNLIIPDTTPKGTFRYSKNLQSIERTENAKDMINELYAFGEGSGEDQVSAGPFTSDPAGYGWNITDIWEEQFFDNQTDLANAAQRYLDRFDTPKVSYRGTAVDLRRLTDVNDFDLGDYIRIYDPILGIEDTVPVVEIAKNKVMGEPLRLEIELANRQRRFPEYGALAFKDEATEENLATGSVSGGVGGALAGGSVGETELAGEAVTWDKIKFKDASGDYMEQTRLKIDALVTFENNFTEIDKLDDGTTYAKMRKSWRSASDVTKIAGGKIFTDSVDLDRINFSPTASKNIVGEINANYNGLTIDTDILDIVGSTSINLASDGTISLNAPNVDITSLNDDGNWGSRITANEDQISLNVSDVDDNESSIQQNADEIALKVDATVDDVMSYINLSGQGIVIGTDGTGTSQIELVGGNAINITASGIETDESAINLEASQINITGITTLDSWQYGTSTTIDGGQVETDTVNVNKLHIDADINMSEDGVNVITGCESISNGTDAIYLTGGQVQAGSQLLASNGIDMSTADIINPGNIDGVNLSFHAQDEDAHQELLGGTDISVTYGTGQVTIDVSGGIPSSLSGLDDVGSISPTTDDILYWDGIDFAVDSIPNITGWSEGDLSGFWEVTGSSYKTLTTDDGTTLDVYLITNYNDGFSTNVITY